LAKVVVIDDDGVRRATLVDLLVGQNHRVRAASNAAAAVEAHLAQPADFVIASGAFGGVAGVGLAEQLQKPPRPADVILVYGEADAAVEGQAALRGIRLRGCLPWPPDRARLTALLRPAASVDTAAPGDWSGAGFLESVRGPLERVPIPRLLFLAHRVDASGAVVWQRPDGQARVFVRSGRVLQVDGVPCLFDTLDLPASSPQDLVGGVAAAVGAGTPFPNVLEAVSVALAGWLVDHEGREGGTVWFDPHAQAPPGAFALPTPIPRLLASGLRQTRTTAALARQWSARSHASLAVRAPDDAPEGRSSSPPGRSMSRTSSAWRSRASRSVSPRCCARSSCSTCWGCCGSMAARSRRSRSPHRRGAPPRLRHHAYPARPRRRTRTWPGCAPP
jgi:CheY-like chemotaxis protein